MLREGRNLKNLQARYHKQTGEEGIIQALNAYGLLNSSL